MGYPTSLLDYGELSGGLVRMMERFKEEGNLTKDPEADQFLIHFLLVVYFTEGEYCFNRIFSTTLRVIKAVFF